MNGRWARRWRREKGDEPAAIDGASHGTRDSVGRSLLGMTAVWVWVVLVAVTTFHFLPRSLGPWQFTAAHVGTYLVSGLPVLLIAPLVVRKFAGGSRRGLVIGLSLVVAAIAYAAVVLELSSEELLQLTIRMGVTAVVEEFVFRGYLWDRCVELLQESWKAVGLNTVLFVGSHLPVALTQGGGAAQLAGVTAFGVIFCLVRIKTRSLAAPILLHWAVDIGGA